MEDKNKLNGQIINQRASALEKEISNCIGTALFLTGLRGFDEYIYEEYHDYLLNLLEEVSEPIEGALIAWQTDLKDNIRLNYWRTYHLGVVTSVNPLLITNRNGCFGPIRINEPFELVNNYYGCDSDNHRVKYFLPPCLADEILGPL